MTRPLTTSELRELMRLVDSRRGLTNKALAALFGRPVTTIQNAIYRERQRRKRRS